MDKKVSFVRGEKRDPIREMNYEDYAKKPRYGPIEFSKTTEDQKAMNRIIESARTFKPYKKQ